VPNAATPKKSLKERLPKISRDGVLFFGGLAGVFHETVIAESERPTLLFLFATMIGLPAFLRADEKRNEEKKE
jgi:hypothetical protein